MDKNTTSLCTTCGSEICEWLLYMKPCEGCVIHEKHIKILPYVLYVVEKCPMYSKPKPGPKKKRTRIDKKILTVDGEQHSVTEWADIVGVTSAAVYIWLKNGDSYAQEKIQERLRRRR